MVSKRWSKEEKKLLLDLYASGESYEMIGGKLDRSQNAIKLRIENIVYDNITKGKTVQLLSNILNVDNNKIKQMYYSHKSFKEGRGEPTIDITFDNNDDNNITNKAIFKRNEMVIPKSVKNKIGGGNIAESLEDENKVLEAIIKNYKMKKYIRELYIDGKLDKQSTRLCKNIIDQN